MGHPWPRTANPASCRVTHGFKPAFGQRGLTGRLRSRSKARAKAEQKQSKAKQSKAKQSKAKQSKAKQSKAKQSKAKQKQNEVYLTCRDI
ncbi:hypothetical protein P2T68_22755 [Pseudomonas sp. G11]|uniref:hypothetical protein n=1 Tax=Pseudomonas sp. G11 TaxID=528343 RepID=UPI00240299E9|nr:hypothetical protein [Pseudomonas sp. G11]WEX13444.1 hypothetical protein P2T68_22755 [Pseudomonas sp. G11]